MPRKRKPKPDPEPVFESIIEQTETQPEDELTVFRDVLTQNDDERNTEKDLYSVDKLILRPPEDTHWTDNPEYNTFSPGDLVVYKKTKRGKTPSVFKIVGPSNKLNSWSAIQSGERDPITLDGWKIKKATKKVAWHPYEDAYTKWKREQEEKGA